MLPVDQTISMLSAEIEMWVGVLESNEQRLLNMETSDLIGFELLDDGATIGIRAGFALEALLAAVARFRDVTDAAMQFWPSKYGEVSDARGIRTLESSLPRLVRKVTEDLELSNYLLEADAAGRILELQVIDHTTDLIEVFDFFCGLRRYIAKLSILGEGVKAVSIFKHDVLHSKALRLKEALDVKEKRVLTKALRNYLASEYLFPWLPDLEEHAISRYYHTLYEIAELRDVDMPNSVDDLLEEQLEGTEIDQKILEEIHRIFHRIKEVIVEVDDFDEVVRNITASGGQWGADSMVGSDRPVNIIPSPDQEGECHKILLAFARGKGTRGGLKAVLRLIREHLIRCGDSACGGDGPTRGVLLFTDLWDRTIFDESLGDIRAHLESHSCPKVIIGALVNGNQVTPQKIV